MTGFRTMLERLRRSEMAQPVDVVFSTARGSQMPDPQPEGSSGASLARPARRPWRNALAALSAFCGASWQPTLADGRNMVCEGARSGTLSFPGRRL